MSNSARVLLDKDFVKPYTRFHSSYMTNNEFLYVNAQLNGLY